MDKNNTSTRLSTMESNESFESSNKFNIPTFAFAQEFMNIQCKTDGKDISIDQRYIHIQNKPVIRVNCVCINVAEPNSLLSYEWHSKLYKYSFEVLTDLRMILIAIEPIWII